jgi:uncharacterized protein
VSRFVDCPICNTHIAEFRKRAREIEAAGIKKVIVFHSAGYYAQATEQSVNSAAPAIAEPMRPRGAGEKPASKRRVPAGAADNGDVAMPLAEAFAYYGTPRGAVPNYINSFAVQSWAYTSTFDAIGAAKLITVPTIVIHSERALAPSLARRFQADLNNARILWVESSGQIDFYDDPGLIAIGADAVTRFFTAAARQ